jgi:hypothetical protein
MLAHRPPASKGLPATKTHEAKMSGQRPDLKITVRNGEGHLKELVAVWRQAEKEYMSGKIQVTEGLAELFKPGNEIAVFVFPQNGQWYRTETH